MQVEHIVQNFRRYYFHQLAAQCVFSKLFKFSSLCCSLSDEMCAVEQHLFMNMPEAFYDNTIEEWLGCYLHPLKEKLTALIKDAESQLKLE